jgi:NTP pyrophosphatase (non-canonical NTP hydrolase)
MNQIEINRYIKEAHKTAVEKGFYPEGEDKNIGEMLMLIVSELGEALEAHRCGRFAYLNIEPVQTGAIFHKLYTQTDDQFHVFFEENIKDTFEDKKANVFIGLFDLCGYLGIDIDAKEINYGESIPKTFKLAELLLLCSRVVGEMQDETMDKRSHIITAMAYLFAICKKFNIPIEKHIQAKMAYNKTRPAKHGKRH